MDIEEIFESSSLFTSSMGSSEPNLHIDMISKYVEDRLSSKNRMAHDFITGLDWINTNKSLSFQQELKGKLVVLDFFTYCCINCMHILPQLKSLENKFSVGDGLVVIGVHSPKFANERSTENVRAAVKRYEISHPVVNDYSEHLWNALGICCWPTLVIVGPGGELLLYLMGESHEQLLYSFVKEALAVLRTKNLISHHPIPGLGVEHELVEPQQLYFPGKICAIEMPEGLRLAVSDTGHHRVVVLDGDGIVQWIIGGSQSGFEDGSFEMAKFHSPQGLAFSDPSTLYVADTENHALRKVNFHTSTVSTVAGDGIQGDDLVGGGVGVSQRLSSPWDVLPVSDSILMIAMAGCHQLWAYFIKDTTLWKNKAHLGGSCAAAVGSGREENRNNAYARSAGLAQPSGLATTAGRLFVADSESSTVRQVCLRDGSVAPLVGGQADPQNLFAFGDKDGCGVEARLQHPLAVAWSSDKMRLYVCDSYNHKIKVVDPTSRCCSTLRLSNGTDSLNEPGGLCAFGNLLYVADTNNHGIKIINLDDNSIKTMPVRIQPQPNTSKVVHLDPVAKKETSINTKGSVLKLSVSLQIPTDIKLLPESPVHWTLVLPDGWKELETSETEPDKNWTLEVAAGPAGKKEELRPCCRLLFCHDGLCAKRELAFLITVLYSDSAPNQATCHVQHQISMGSS